MNLRTRIVLSYIGSAILLALPAAYGVLALRELRDIAQTLNVRDAQGALRLGRIQTRLSDAENAQRVQLALQTGAEARQARAGVVANLDEVESGLELLASGGYQGQVAPALGALATVREGLVEQQRLISAENVSRADSIQARIIEPGFARLDSLLDPIALAINEGGEDRVRRAAEVAEAATATTLLALIAALLAAVALGAWLTRSILRPIHDLRGGMARVAAGDFDADVPTSAKREDELGDLTRSFETMATRLEELDRLKAEFMSVASHEIKTPLNVIKGYVSLLHDGIYGPVSDDQQKALASVIGQTDHLTRLVKRLLDLSRLEAGSGGLDFHAFPFQHWVSELASGYEVLARQNNANFEFEVVDPLPETVVGDPDRLSEVVGNLMSNAFKFTPPDGRIELRVSPRPNGVAMEVVDSGVGIPADKLPRIFDKFFQVENEAQPKSAGSGLGLAIAREIVEAHGGTITASSKPGQGTTFRVEIPTRPPDAPAEVAPVPENEKATV